MIKARSGPSSSCGTWGAHNPCVYPFNSEAPKPFSAVILRKLLLLLRGKLRPWQEPGRKQMILELSVRAESNRSLPLGLRSVMACRRIPLSESPSYSLASLCARVMLVTSCCHELRHQPTPSPRAGWQEADEAANAVPCLTSCNAAAVEDTSSCKRPNCRLKTT